MPAPSTIAEIVPHLAGEEQPDLLHDSQVRVQKDAKYFRMASGTAEQTVFNGPCRIIAVLVDNGVTSGAITLRDGVAGTTVHISAGSNNRDVEGMRIITALTAQAATTGAGVTVLYREAELS